MNYVAHPDAAEGLVAEIIAAGGRAIAAMADVAEAATVEMMIARAEKQLGPVTVLVNNAGMSWRGTLDNYDPEQVMRMRRVNVEGLIHATRAVIGQLPRARRYGRIVNVSSIAGIGTALPGNAFYAATKAEVAILTKRFAMELGAHNITVNAGAWLRSNRYDTARPRRRRLAGNGRTLCCKGNDGAHRRTRGHRQPSRFLGLTESGWITAQALSVDGGRMDYIGHV